jgi:hypothetical protein
MNSEFEDCLRRQRVREFSRGKTLVGKELRTAENDLAEARKSFDQQGYKWATIQSYYSMFHSASAESLCSMRQKSFWQWPVN